MLLDGRAQESGIRRRGSDATLLIVYNAHFDVVNFVLPSVPEGASWLGLVDTNKPEIQLPAFPFNHVYEVTGRSLLAFALSTGDRLTQRLRRGIGLIEDALELPLDPE